MKAKNPERCVCIVIHRFDQPRAVSFKAVCWEGPLEFLLFFVVRLLTPETEELICINMVVMVMVLVVGWAASPLPVWHFYLNTSLHPCSPQQQLFSSSFSSDRNRDHWCARLGVLPPSTGTEAVGGCAQHFKPFPCSLYGAKLEEFSWNDSLHPTVSVPPFVSSLVVQVKAPHWFVALIRPRGRMSSFQISLIDEMKLNHSLGSPLCLKIK